jgi:hypothetical protein
MINLTCTHCRAARSADAPVPFIHRYSETSAVCGDISPWPRVVDCRVLVEAFDALDAVIQCEPFADMAPPGTEGFAVYELVAAARERLAEVLGIAGPDAVA